MSIETFLLKSLPLRLRREGIAEIEDTPARSIPDTLRRLGEIIRYELRPLERPRVDDESDRLIWPARVAEVFCYNLLCLGYAIARNGRLRAYTLLNLRLLLFCSSPSRRSWFC